MIICCFYKKNLKIAYKIVYKCSKYEYNVTEFTQQKNIIPWHGICCIKDFYGENTFMVKYVKCPRCELNYIDSETQEYCDVCIAEMKGNRLQFADLDEEELEALDAELESGEICPICGINPLAMGEKICESCRQLKDYDEEEEVDIEKDEEWKNYLEEDDSDLSAEDTELDAELKAELEEEEEEDDLYHGEDDFFESEDVDSLDDLEDDEFDDDDEDDFDDDDF